MTSARAIFAFTFLIATVPAFAHEHGEVMGGSASCEDMEVWNYASGMCQPLPMAGMPMRMLMIHGNAFGVQTWQEKPRGRDRFAAPNMFMADLGTSVGDRHYLNAEFMGTLEKWTIPKDGYPEFLQIGEENHDHVPFLDAQHPHSSPVMGLTFSDTIALGEGKDHLMLSFAPRGQSTDGPVAFMHRPTGMVNPDAPLGHHIGQDVGHISSTVLAASIHLERTTLEVSAFNGREPKPSEVDLPLATPNSYAARLTREFSAHSYGMASAAYVKDPEKGDPTLTHVWRYSASLYREREFNGGWTLNRTLIWGLINGYDYVSALNSFTWEFLLKKKPCSIWSRVEVLQRSPLELEIPVAANGDKGRWVTAVTLGYTHALGQWDALELGLGASVTKDFLPAVYRDAYGGNPVTARLFLQASGMKMWDL